MRDRHGQTGRWRRARKKAATFGVACKPRYARVGLWERSIRGDDMPWHDEELWDDAPLDIDLEA
jgi:hypothetical protein